MMRKTTLSVDSTDERHKEAKILEKDIPEILAK